MRFQRNYGEKESHKRESTLQMSFQFKLSYSLRYNSSISNFYSLTSYLYTTKTEGKQHKCPYNSQQPSAAVDSQVKTNPYPFSGSGKASILLSLCLHHHQQFY